MAFKFTLNFEPMLCELIEENISRLNSNIISNNYDDLKDVDNGLFVNNLKYATQSVVLMAMLYESVLNSIITNKLNFKSKEFLKASHGLKLQLICHEYKIDYNLIKGSNYYQALKEVLQFRNDVVHYKTNLFFLGTMFHDEIVKESLDKSVDGIISKKPISELVSKSNIESYYAGIRGFIEDLCKKCNLSINQYCKVIECDGLFGFTDYVVTEIEKNDIEKIMKIKEK